MTAKIARSLLALLLWYLIVAGLLLAYFHAQGQKRGFDIVSLVFSVPLGLAIVKTCSLIAARLGRVPSTLLGILVGLLCTAVEGLLLGIALSDSFAGPAIAYAWARTLLIPSGLGGAVVGWFLWRVPER